jgi:hypothetical protein
MAAGTAGLHNGARWRRWRRAYHSRVDNDASRGWNKAACCAGGVAHVRKRPSRDAMPELPPQAHSSNNEDQQPELRSDNVDGLERLSTGLRGLFHPPRYLSATGPYCAPYTRCLPIDCRPCPREPSGPFLYHTGTPITLIVSSVHITYIPAPHRYLAA